MVVVTASLVVLTAALLSWKSDIEAKGGARLLVAEVQHQAERNEFTLADDTPGRELFVEYLKQDQFMRQFSLMYAVMIHHKSPSGGTYLIYKYNQSMKFRINKVRGELATLSGIFFDPR